jgi:hypothetical protein
MKKKKKIKISQEGKICGFGKKGKEMTGTSARR